MGSSPFSIFKTTIRALLAPLALLLAPAVASHAQTFSLDWWTIDGGGGTSTGGVFAVTGTIGQPDASATMSGGNFTLQGGFWGIVAAVQTPGAPCLSVTRSNTAVVVSWPKADPAWKLEFASQLVTVGLDHGSSVFTGDARWLAIEVRTNGAGRSSWAIRSSPTRCPTSTLTTA